MTMDWLIFTLIVLLAVLVPALATMMMHIHIVHLIDRQDKTMKKLAEEVYRIHEHFAIKRSPRPVVMGKSIAVNIDDLPWHQKLMR